MQEVWPVGWRSCWHLWAFRSELFNMICRCVSTSFDQTDDCQDIYNQLHSSYYFTNLRRIPYLLLLHPRILTCPMPTIADAISQFPSAGAQNCTRHDLLMLLLRMLNGPLLQLFKRLLNILTMLMAIRRNLYSSSISTNNGCTPPCQKIPLDENSQGT
jgi:hypothetical protein